MADTQKTVTVSTKWKDDGLGNLSREVKKVGNGFEELKRQVKAADGTITTTLSKTGSASNSFGKNVTKSMGLVQKSMNGVTASVKGLFVKMVAFETIKKVFKGLYDSWALYDKAIGANNVDKLKKSFEELQLQVGSVLAPTMNSLVKELDTNINGTKESIGSIVNVFTEAAKAIWNLLNLGSAAISTLVTGTIAATLKIIYAMYTPLEILLNYIPGVNLNIRSELAKNIDYYAKMTQNLGDETVKAFKAIGKNIQAAFKVPEVTNVKLVSDDDKRKAEAAEKERLAFKEKMLGYQLDLEKEIENARINLMEDGLAKDIRIIELKYNIESEVATKKLLEAKEISTAESKLVESSAETQLKLIATQQLLEIDGAKKVHAVKIGGLIAYTDAYRKYFHALMNYQSIIEDNEASRSLKSGVKLFGANKGLSNLKVPSALDYVNVPPPGIAEAVRSYTKSEYIIRMAESAKGQSELLEQLDIYYENVQILAMQYAEEQKFSDQETANLATDIAKDRESVITEITKAAEEERTRIKIEAVNRQVEMYAMMADSVFSIVGNLHKVELNNIDAEKEKRTEYINSTVKSERRRQKAIERLDDEMEEKRKESYRKQQGWAIAQTTIDGAVAIMKGFADYGPVVGAIMAALTTTVTATQIAAISSQKFASGGIVQGSGQKDSKRAMLSPGEAVLTTEQQRRFMAIANGQVVPGGGASIISNDTIIVNGSLDMAAAERIRVDRERQLARLRDDMRELKYRGQLVVA